jgi:hypothetical protein
MLEFASLWLSAPTGTWPPGLSRTGRCLRWVLAGDTRAPLGHVAVTPGRWWPWPAGCRIAAYESPDGSLLFTARQAGWLRRRAVVADADGKAVALIRGPYLLGPGNRFVAYHRAETDNRSGTFAGPNGSDVAQWRADGVGVLLEFADEVKREPLTRMALLGAVLTNS